MRILLATYAQRTPFFSMVPLAWALSAAGHEVRVASQPQLTEAVTAAGLTAVPVGRDHSLWRIMRLNPGFRDVASSGRAPVFDMAEEPEEAVTWERLQGGYAGVVTGAWRVVNDTMIGELVDFCLSWRPDLVIWEPSTYAGAVAAEAAGAAHARLLCGPDLYGRLREHYIRQRDRRPADSRPDPLAEWLAARGRRFGVAFTERLTSGHFTIDQLPPALRLTADLDYVPMRYTPYNGTAVVPEWLWRPARRPRVCLTLGSSSTEYLDGYPVSVQDILDSLGDLEIEVVATLSPEVRERLSGIPDNTRVVDYVPLHALVPDCAAVIHHGGWGTLCTTAVNGVPHLVLPHEFDAPFLGRRIAARGAGLALFGEEATGAKIREGLLRLLAEPGFGERAALLREEMRAMPTPGEVVPELERLARTHRSGASRTPR